MIEIFNIFFLIISMIWICSFPLIQNNSKKSFIFNKFTNLEKISINLSIFLNILLILSFYKINLQYIFLTLLIFPLINFIYFHKKLSFQNLAILFFFTFILSISISSNLKLEWDGAATWIYKTINFFSGNSFSNLSEIPGMITYPHLGSYMWAFFWKNSFIDSEYVGRIFFVFSYCLSILLIVGLSKNKLSNKILFISGFTILTLDYYLFAGYQEFLVFSILIFIFYFYLRYFIQKQKIFLIPIVFFINAIIWVKNEAIVFVLFFFLFVIFHHLIEKHKVKNAIFILGTFFIFVVFIKYFIFYKNFNKMNLGMGDIVFQINSLKDIFQIDYFIERSSSIIMSIVVALIKCKVYLMFFLTLLFCLNNKNFKIFLPYMFFLFLKIILIFLIYYLTSSPGWQLFQATTVDRLLFQTSGIYLVPIYLILKKIDYLNT